MNAAGRSPHGGRGAADEDRLSAYRRKRDFGETPEPAGQAHRKPYPFEEPIFVVQKHRARSLHYDFRLEVGGVLASWAVPKGPSLRPEDKRLAVRTEDHPLEYASFEGTIPAGQYGAGTVLVWDVGFYRCLGRGAEAVNEGLRGEQEAIRAGLEAGNLRVWLEGHRLRGGFLLQRMHSAGRQEQWLLRKLDDAHAAPLRDVAADEPRSILTDRTLEQIAGGPLRHDAAR